LRGAPRAIVLSVNGRADPFARARWRRDERWFSAFQRPREREALNRPVDAPLTDRCAMTRA